MVDCGCVDCDEGCDMVAAPDLFDEDGQPLCTECGSMGMHRQDREDDE